MLLFFRAKSHNKMASLATILTILFVIVFVAAIFPKAVKLTVSSNWYKRRYAKRQHKWTELTALVFEPLKRKLFADLDEKLREVNGDVLEIGIGSGQNFNYYPRGTSLIAVDPNPHVEKLLEKNLEKAGGRVCLKKFVVASAEDMSCSGKVGVEDSCVAAVVCTKLMCSLTDEQMSKTIQEVKRVLMPVSSTFGLFYRTGERKILSVWGGVEWGLRSGRGEGRGGAFT